MEVAQLAVGRFLSGEHLKWAQSSVFARCVVNDPQCVEGAEGPERSVTDVRPVDGLMVHLGTGQ